ADQPEHAGVGRGIRSRRPPDRRLVDVDHLVDRVAPRDPLVRSRWIERTVELSRERAVQDVVHERALPRSRYAGHADEGPERESRADTLEVVLPRPDDLDPGAVPGAAHLGHADL